MEGRDVREACDRSDPGHMAVVADCPAQVAKCPKQQAEHEKESELGLIDAPVASGHPNDPPVAERTSSDHCEDNPDDAPNVSEAL